MKQFALVAALVLTVAGACAADTASDKPTTGSAAVTAKASKKGKGAKDKGTPVGNKHCPIMPDEPVNERNKSVTYNGQLVRVCCKKCIAKFNEDPEKYLKKAQEDAKAAN